MRLIRATCSEDCNTDESIWNRGVLVRLISEGSYCEVYEGHIFEGCNTDEEILNQNSGRRPES